MVQVTPEKLFIRIKFRKTGRLQYISHLDLVRTMNKIVVRSGLPLWYTEGFNPKPKMVFAAPLSIGTESHFEFMDLRLTERVDTDLALDRLNANMTDELVCTEAYYPESPFTALRWLKYEMELVTSGASEELAGKCNEALASEKMEILKKTKSGEAVVDIKPLVHSATARFEDGKIRITAILSADPSSFLNPEYVVKLLRERCNVLSSSDLTSEHYSILRTEGYFSDMTLFR